MSSHQPERLPAAFNRLAWSNLAAQSAEQVGLAAAPIVAVVALGAGEGATGLLQTAQTLPFLLMSIPAGVLGDRMSRARLMTAAESLRVLSLLAVLALIALGALTLPLLALLGFIGACGTVAFGVTAPALVPALVKAEALPAANGRTSSRAPPRLPLVRRWVAHWSGGSAADWPSASPRRCRSVRSSSLPVWLSRHVPRARCSIRCAICAKVRHSCSVIPTCGRFW